MFFSFDESAPIEHNKLIDDENDPTQIYNKYAGNKSLEGKPVTLSGYARALGLESLPELKALANSDPKVRKAVLDIHTNYEECLTTPGMSSSGAQFALSAMFGWKSEQSIKIKKEPDVTELSNMSDEELMKLLNRAPKVTEPEVEIDDCK